VDAAHRRPQAALDAAIGGADRVIEHHDLRGAGLALDQRLDLGLVDPAHLVAIVEVAHRRLVLGKHEGLAIERQVSGDRPHVVDSHLEIAIVAESARDASADRRVVGDGLDAEIGEVGNAGLDPGGKWRLRNAGRSVLDGWHGIPPDRSRTNI